MKRRPNIAVLVFTDGRGDCLERTLTSFVQAWGAQPVDSVTIINDSAEPVYADRLNRRYAGYDRVHHVDRRGFAGAVQSGWSLASDADWIFHLEDDFTFNEPIDVFGMIAVLEAHPYLAQLALLRQPWNEQEEAAGGIMQQWPDEYEEKTDGVNWWTEHRLFFTTNPSFYRGSLTELGWPDAPNSEAKFTQNVLQDPAARFAFWGRKDDAPRVHHIGEHRVGTGY